MNSPIMSALTLFDAAEANLEKLERLWAKIDTLTLDGFASGESPEYGETRRAFDAVVSALPKIGGWKLEFSLPPEISTIARNRLEPGRLIREYGFRLRQKRRELVRALLVDLIATVDQTVLKIRTELGNSPSSAIEPPRWDELRTQFDQLRVLLGKDVPSKARWSEMARHLGWGMIQDFDDIESMDWPSVKAAITSGLYGEDEPISVAVDDLADVVAKKPRGPVSLKLNWQKIDAEQFERLIYMLISSEPGYENAQWQMKTNAPDRGRDLSATRVWEDGLSGTLRERVIIQCRHWQSRSIGLADVALLKEQMSLWNDPPVSVLIIATSGRFTVEAVQWIERQQLPKIEMWPESHIERLLAARPALIAEFGLR